MDKIDRKILAELQMDGRLSITDLAERVGLSLSPCHRRVKALEESGTITGYKARLDPRHLGFNFSAIVFVTLREGDRKAVEAFENSVVQIPEVIQAQRLFGDPDYFLYVVTHDLIAFQKLYDEQLSSLPSVLRLTSTLVMKDVVQDRSFPL
ncbi:MAG: Lrp/AsnC family transcriptional regulator [Gammaproteobacteria bacterium]|nr:Lrp/AsnC family transcriptional regulator [Gammaproteobacteria bacterium]